MQIDFHHAATYVVARAAGLDHETASTVSHSAQYVDDATNAGVVEFREDVRQYRRLASAHGMLDYKNLSSLRNSECWVPFHFLPGNCGVPAGQTCNKPIENRLICLPNSLVAQDMMRAAIADKAKPYGKHRLGIAAHVFMDTFAHQNFAGVQHEINRVKDLEWLPEESGSDWSEDSIFNEKSRNTLGSRLKSWWQTDNKSYGGIWGKTTALVQNIAQSDIPPLGHGQALGYPDRPYLRWRYTNGLGETVDRDNRKDFRTASNELCKWFQRWLANDPDANVAGLSQEVAEKIGALIDKTKLPDGEVRHAGWIELLAHDHFGFGAVQLDYISKGPGSWKDQSVGSQVDVAPVKEVYHYDDAFLTSDWKYFHDAAKAHRLEVLDDILPRYGIVVV